jgi:hypothetical protein
MFIMAKQVIISLAVVALLAAATGCVKQPLDHLSNNDTKVYITNHDSTANFTSFKTFSITDSVAVIRDNRLTVKTITPTDSAFIAAVSAQLQQRGYTLVAKGQEPDLGVSLNRIYNTSTELVDYGNYWGDYFDYWDPYYWGYPGYPYYSDYVGVYSVTNGAVAIDLVDLKDAAASNKIKSVWSGLIQGEGIIDQSSASAEVQALFAQSPYVKAN